MPMLALLMMVGWRLTIHWILGHPEVGERILIVGSGPFAVEIARETLGRPDAGFRVVGFVDNDPSLVGKSLMPKNAVSAPSIARQIAIKMVLGPQQAALLAKSDLSVHLKNGAVELQGTDCNGSTKVLLSVKP